MTDDRTLGRVLHDARIKHNPPAERPRNVAPWDERAPWQQQLDEAMAADLEAVVRARIAVELRRLADDAAAQPVTVPGIERRTRRDTYLAAVQVVLNGLAQERSGDDKEGPRS